MTKVWKEGHFYFSKVFEGPPWILIQGGNWVGGGVVLFAMINNAFSSNGWKMIRDQVIEREQATVSLRIKYRAGQMTIQRSPNSFSVYSE